MLAALVLACSSAPTPHRPADPCASVPGVGPNGPVPFEEGQGGEHLEAQACAWEAKGSEDALAQALQYARASADQRGGKAASYLAARLTARLRSAPQGVCAYDAYQSELLQELVTAAQDPELRAAMVAEPLFAPYHGAIRYRVALGQTPAEIAAHASGLVLYSPPAGVIGNAVAVELQDGGAAHVRTRDPDDPSKTREQDLPHAWKADGDSIEIDLGSGPPTKGRVDVDGRLVQGTETAWFDAPAECSV